MLINSAYALDRADVKSVLAAEIARMRGLDFAVRNVIFLIALKTGVILAIKQKPSHGGEGFCFIRSLTMTYFHIRMYTIIGAKSFHCPVRDGKEWDQLAMVVRHNCRLTGYLN